MKKSNYKIQQLKLIAYIGDVSSTIRLGDGLVFYSVKPGTKAD